jgi:hypothetical protein
MVVKILHFLKLGIFARSLTFGGVRSREAAQPMAVKSLAQVCI